MVVALDGSNSAAFNPAATGSVSLSTTQSQDAIIVYFSILGTTVVSSVTATGLTFNRRGTVSYSTTTRAEEWYATTSSVFTSTISFSLAASTTVVATAFGVSGVDTTTPFDSASLLPTTTFGTGTTPLVQISTSNTNDFIIGLLTNDKQITNVTPDTNFTVIVNNHAGAAIQGVSEYQIVGGTVSNFSVGYTLSGGGSNSVHWSIIGDALHSGTLKVSPSSSIITQSLNQKKPTKNLPTTFLKGLSRLSKQPNKKLSALITTLSNINTFFIRGLGFRNNFRIRESYWEADWTIFGVNVAVIGQALASVAHIGSILINNLIRFSSQVLAQFQRFINVASSLIIGTPSIPSIVGPPTTGFVKAIGKTLSNALKFISNSTKQSTFVRNFSQNLKFISSLLKTADKQISNAITLISSFNKTLTLFRSFLSSISLGNNNPTLVEGTNLVGYWPLDEGSGTTAFDYSGNNDSATFIGSPSPGWVTGLYGNAVAFSSGSSYLNVSANNSLNPTDIVTVTAWSYISSISGTQNEVVNGGGFSDGWRFVVTPTSQFFEISIGLASPLAPNTPIQSFNNWHFLVGSYDGNSAKLYVDNALKATVTSAGTIHYIAGSNVKMGNNLAVGMTQRLDDIRIYHSILSANDMSTLFSNGPSVGSFYKTITKPESSSISISSSFSRIFTLIRAFVQTLIITSLLSRVSTFIRSFTQNISISSILQKNFTKLISNTLTISSISTRIVTYIRQMTQNLSFFFSLRKTITKPIISNLSFSSLLGKINGKTITSRISITSSSVKNLTKPITNILTIIFSIPQKTINKVEVSSLQISTLMIRIFNLFRVFTQTLTIFSSLSKNFTKIISNSLSILSSLTSTRTFVLIFTQALNIISRATKTLTKAISNILNITSFISRISTFIRIFTQALQVVSSLTKTITKAVSSTLIIASSLARIVTYLIGLTQNININSLLQKQLNKVIINLLNIVSSLSTGAHALVVSLNQTLTLLSSLTKNMNKSITNTLSLSSLFIRLFTITRSFISFLSFLSSLSKTINKTNTSILTISSLFNRVTTYVRRLTQNIAISSSLIKSITKPISNNINLVTSLLATRLFVRVFTQTLTIVSSLTKTFTKGISNQLNLTSFESRITTFIRTFTQTLSIVSLLQKLVNKNIISSLSFVSLSSRITTFIRTLAQTLTVLSLTTKAFTKVLSSSLSISFSLETIKMYVLSFFQTLAITSSFSKVITYIRTLNQTINLSSFFTRSTSFILFLTQNLFILSNINKILNKVVNNELTIVSSIQAKITILKIVILGSLSFISNETKTLIKPIQNNIQISEFINVLRSLFINISNVFSFISSLALSPLFLYILPPLHALVTFIRLKVKEIVESI